MRAALLAFVTSFALILTMHAGEVDTKGKTMATKDTVQRYFDALKQNDGWDAFLSDEMMFTSFTSPAKQIKGKEAYLQGTKRFYSSIVSFEVLDIIVDHDEACAFTRYELQGPGGSRFSSDVAERFTVKDGKIVSFGIYFDSAPFPK